MGVEYISYAFIVDFAKKPLHGGVGHLMAYLPFVVVAFTGPLLRLAAAAKRIGEERGLAIS